MRNSLGEKARLQHIYDAILEIESYVKNSSYEEFESNTMMHYACVKQLEIIGVRFHSCIAARQKDGG